jgi:hypothetical protein
MVNSEVTCSSFFIHVAFVSCESQLLWFCDLCGLTTLQRWYQVWRGLFYECLSENFETSQPGIFYMNMCLLKHRCILWAGLHCEFTRQQALHLQMDADETTDQGFELYLPWYQFLLLNLHHVVRQSCKHKERKFIMFRLKISRLWRRVQHIDGR